MHNEANLLCSTAWCSGMTGQVFDMCIPLPSMMMMMMMMTVDLYGALRRAPQLRYVSRCIVKSNFFSADRKDPMLSDGSRRWSGSRFQNIGPATENARHPNLLRRWRGAISWWGVADQRRWRLAMSDVGMQQLISITQYIIVENVLIRAMLSWKRCRDILIWYRTKAVILQVTIGDRR